MSCNSTEWFCSSQDSPDLPTYKVRLLKEAKYKLAIFKIKRKINLNDVKQMITEIT